MGTDSDRAIQGVRRGILPSTTHASIRAFVARKADTDKRKGSTMEAIADRKAVASIIHDCDISDIDANMLKLAKMRKVFRVEVRFQDGTEPDVIVSGTYSARKAIDAAREWAMTENRNAALKRFGKRESVKVDRIRKGESVTVTIPAKDNPTAREKLMAQALNGGGFSISMEGGFSIVGTFVGYVPAV